MIYHPHPDLQCDVCGATTNRLHECWAYGLETWACDDCTHYDYEAYDEPPARYRDPDAELDRLRDDMQAWNRDHP